MVNIVLVYVYLMCDMRIFFYLHCLRKFREDPRTPGGIEIDLEYQPVLLVYIFALNEYKHKYCDEEHRISVSLW
jgi:hypothetical protein